MAKKKKGTEAPRREVGTPKAPRRVSTPRTRREIEAEWEMRRKKRARTVKIVAIIALAALVLGIVALVIYGAVLGHEIDYDKDDLSRYVYISEEDYKNIALSVKLDPVDDLTIDDTLIKLLYKYKTEDPDYEGKVMTSLASGDVLGIGDHTNLFYIGYMKNDDGTVSYFNGGSNLHQYTGSMHDSGSPCYIGYTATSSEGGEMIPGFALGLIGKNPSDYSRLSIVKDRAVRDGDIISFTYLEIAPDADSSSSSSTVTTTVHVGSEECATLFGEEFSDFIIGREIGSISDAYTVDDEDGKTIYSKMKINGIYNLGDSPLTVTARFPVNYDAPTLAGKVVYFDVYISDMTLYDVPKIDEEFITKHMGMTLAQLDEYADADSVTIYDKFRDYVRSEAIAAQQLIIDEAAQGAMWDTYLEHAKVKWIPEREIAEYYGDYVDEVESAFQSAQSNGTATDLDGYALTYLQLEPGEDWHAHLRETAVRAVTEKLIFYYVLRQEGFLPEGEEYDKLYDELVDEVLAEYLGRISCKRENYDSDAAYEAAVAKHRETVVAGYGEDYFHENVIYLYAIEKMIDMATVTEERAEPIGKDEYQPITP